MTSIDLFDYQLPERLIAQRPSAGRGESRLMAVNRADGRTRHLRFADFPSLLREGDTLAINVTKVFPARLITRRKTGAVVEILLIRNLGGGEWEALAGGAQKVKDGEVLLAGDGAVTFLKKRDDGKALVRFEPESEMKRLTETFGQVPLPPYIKRESGAADSADRDRYQTVFASLEGSCAAPTAGLHFSDAIMEKIKRLGVVVVPVTLHVGPGTFRPVKSEVIEDHVMDAEPFEISEDSAQAINAAKREKRRVVAVGSTVTRLLESAAGDNGLLRHGRGETRLFITPGYKFRAVDALLTNFHLPKSTLLILVSAFMGRELALKAYEEAVREEYKFFSYGDAMFIE
ncbi:MAG: tRNA preQ1(34) S-adenosylmethionine ribosyltransferase-isomerase QueA [Nitrospinae bacterium]|nr:tRNA preQ1(34) S-adenosylmethionine ribosyltransferase-isomerase QueA [Nitrospinota bacterium]